MELTTLTTYVEKLENYLQWDPIQNRQGQEKHLFVQALTELAALPLDSINMEIRRLLVVPTTGTLSQETTLNTIDYHTGKVETRPMHLRNVIAALSARDVLLKCKAANAVGSLCISRVAGQQLLDLYGDEILKSVSKMAMGKNQWMQGDAFFVLGWMVVIADKSMLVSIGDLLPTVIRGLHRNLKLSLEKEADADKEMKKVARRRSKAALISSEQASNFRIYALVLLLNFSQRHVNVFENQLERLLPMLRDLVARLLDSVPYAFVDDECTISDLTTTIFFDASEYAEVLRLTVALLSVIADQLDSVGPQLLELKALPCIIKLQRVPDLPQICELVGETARQDIAERVRAVVEILLKCR
ncbi:unnamed protein product [Peronospora belbahrii]|uniref:Tubulin-specific chaperone D C-terminal domain-containing protein n=1 Tax=Peronospora belbahrii TaxID=622444 RepID=A0AAU9L3K1_9STRA|nr:unnamed protein product [Peronospora belbahrii]CAH0521159.1 unnamed protein product [Peronospora belbahrii]